MFVTICVSRGVCFGVWVYMVCVACMIFAHGVAVKFVIALIAEKRQKSYAISPTPKAQCQKRTQRQKPNAEIPTTKNPTPKAQRKNDKCKAIISFQL